MGKKPKYFKYKRKVEFNWIYRINIDFSLIRYIRKITELMLGRLKYAPKVYISWFYKYVSWY